jgi:hypothetical protein
LISQLDASPDRLTDEQIESAFSEVQSLRQDRAQQAVDIAKDVQSVEAMQVPGASLMVKIMLPLLTKDMRLERQSGVIVDAVRVNNLPMPYREHYVPYVDELPAKPIRKARFSKLAVLASFSGLFWLANNGLQVGSLPAVFRGQPFKTTYTGVSPVDSQLTTIIRAFSMSVASPDPAQYLQAMYLVASLTPAILIWLIEGYRRGNNQTIPGKLILW